MAEAEGAGGDGHSIDINQITQAAAKAETNTLRALLRDAPQDIIHKRSRYGYTPIQAMNSMSPETTRILLEHGADPNVMDRCRRTPLHDVVENGCLATVKLLLDNGADPVARDNTGKTPGHLAAQRGGRSGREILEKLSPLCTLQELNHDNKTPLDVAADLRTVKRQTNPQYSDHDEVIKWIEEFQCRPQSLMFLARRVIRGKMSILKIPELIAKKLLPSVLLPFLTDNEHEHEEQDEDR